MRLGRHHRAGRERRTQVARRVVVLPRTRLDEALFGKFVHTRHVHTHGGHEQDGVTELGLLARLGPVEFFAHDIDDAWERLDGGLRVEEGHA